MTWIGLAIVLVIWAAVIWLLCRMIGFNRLDDDQDDQKRIFNKHTRRNTMTDLPKQAAIANEIKTALADGAKLTSAELCAKSHTALDSTDISRVIGDLKAAGLVAQSGTKKSTATGGTSKAWAWIGPPDAAVPRSTAHRKPVAKAVESIEDEAPVVEVAVDPDTLTPLTRTIEPEPAVVGVTDRTTVFGSSVWRTDDVRPGQISDTRDEPAVDPIEMALADLVDQTDESALSFADSMLSDHPTWRSLRQMQDDAFQLLCDYRLTKTLEKP